MKANRFIWTLLLLLTVAVQLPAQQSEADQKLLADIRAKAEKGDAQSQDELGAAFDEGSLGVAKDEVEAVKWYRKAADQGFADAQYNLGVCYHDGTGVAKDEVEAVNWVRKAAEQGDADAQNTLGVCYERGEGVAKDATEAVKWYRKAADQGFADAQYNLGVCYANGQGVPKDDVEAVNWFRKAAVQNFAAAQYNLSVCYAKGDGVRENAVESAKWLRMAAEQNFANAQETLGSRYAVGGLGVAKDEVEAVKWWRKAAEQNLAIAQYWLGDRYRNGQGVARDSVEAAKWYRKAAEQNYAPAEYNLGVCYRDSQGVANDYVEAVKWFRKAAVQNHPLGQTGLGACYYNGRGVPKDYVEAYNWWLLAAAQGEAKAKENIAIVEGMMTREQIAEGQKLARNFKPPEVPAAGSDSSGTAIAQTRPQSSGTGFFITTDGYLVTNEHVAGNGAQVRLVTSAGLISARVVKVDSANDLALLKAEGRFAPLPIAASRTMRLGGTVATVGFPNIGLQGFSPKLTKGEISSLSGVQDDPRCFQISVPAQPGNSGGALVDERGNVVGVVSAKLNAWAALSRSGMLPENVNYAVKSSFLLSFLESVPDVSAKLKAPVTADRKFEDVVKSAQDAAVLVLVY